MKTLVVIGAFIAVAAGGLKAQRYENIENNREARSKIEIGIRQTAADFNPQVSTTPRELKDFEVQSVKVTRPRAMPYLDSLAGGDKNYEVFVRYREGGVPRCMTLELKERHDDGGWSVSHPGSMDRCDPAW
jgi:hypothetical protein